MIFSITLKSINNSVAHFELGDGGSININLANAEPAKALRNKMLFDAFYDASQRGILVSYDQIDQIINNINNFKFDF